MVPVRFVCMCVCVCVTASDWLNGNLPNAVAYTILHVKTQACVGNVRPMVLMHLCGEDGAFGRRLGLIYGLGVRPALLYVGHNHRWPSGQQRVIQPGTRVRCPLVSLPCQGL